jgi:hypothetical protein
MTPKKLRKFALIDFSDAIEMILRDDTMRVVTLFCKPLSDVTQRVRITRRSKNELVVTYGKPNYEEREFLKLCKKAKTNPKRVLFKFFKK